MRPLKSCDAFTLLYEVSDCSVFGVLPGLLEELADSLVIRAKPACKAILEGFPVLFLKACELRVLG